MDYYAFKEKVYLLDIMSTNIRIPERKTQKCLLTLPEDQVLLIDSCARAIGLSRSSFMQIYFDNRAEDLGAFTTGWLAGNKYYQDTLNTNKSLENASKVVQNLTSTKITVIKGK